mmetsp:Transcript_14958/g.16597  ORF Transcript_14958/g.16597 Transcript_14958/m.16597 type:complete len:222 (+) Transcript_14958:324-989(+)
MSTTTTTIITTEVSQEAQDNSHVEASEVTSTSDELLEYKDQQLEEEDLEEDGEASSDHDDCEVSTTVGIDKSAISKSRKRRPKERKHKCKYMDCDARFHNKFNLRRHVLLMHLKTRAFLCERCGKRFAMQHHMREHQMHHYRIDFSLPASYKVKNAVAKKLLDQVPDHTIYRSLLSDVLPLFFVEKPNEEELIPAKVNFMNLPDFVERGYMIVPPTWNLAP